MSISNNIYFLSYLISLTSDDFSSVSKEGISDFSSFDTELTSDDFSSVDQELISDDFSSVDQELTSDDFYSVDKERISSVDQELISDDFSSVDQERISDDFYSVDKERISDEKEAVNTPLPSLVLINDTLNLTLGVPNQIFSSAAARSYSVCRIKVPSSVI